MDEHKFNEDLTRAAITAVSNGLSGLVALLVVKGVIGLEEKDSIAGLMMRSVDPFPPQVAEAAKQTIRETFRELDVRLQTPPKADGNA